MQKLIMTQKQIVKFKRHLAAEEKSEATIEKYVRDITKFYQYLPEDKLITKVKTVEFKNDLSFTYKRSSVNSMLAALNCFLDFYGLPECRVKLLKLQRRTFRSQKMELSKDEYTLLVEAAKQVNNERLDLVMETICSCGIRVGELRFITVEAIGNGCAEISWKGKERIIIIPEKLQNKLNTYCKMRDIQGGSVFVTRTGKPVNRSNIWRDMKKLCELTAVHDAKVYPHNLRHLFALTYYHLQGDIVHLADVLGHSSIETTRIYTIHSSEEQGKKIEELELII